MGKGKGKGKSYEPEPYWGPPSKAQSHRVPGPVDVDLQQRSPEFRYDPKRPQKTHSDQTPETPQGGMIAWMSLGLAPWAPEKGLGPADGDVAAFRM